MIEHKYPSQMSIAGTRHSGTFPKFTMMENLEAFNMQGRDTLDLSIRRHFLWLFDRVKNDRVERADFAFDSKMYHKFKDLSEENQLYNYAIIGYNNLEKFFNHIQEHHPEWLI